MGLKEKMRMKKKLLDEEEKANIYGFKRKFLQSPTSVSMMNSYAIKKANV